MYYFKTSVILSVAFSVAILLVTTESFSNIFNAIKITDTSNIIYNNKVLDPYSAVADKQSTAYKILKQGKNPYPSKYQLPATQPLSAVAQLGKKLFFDPSLSGSGKLSCAGCHDPNNAFAPNNKLSVQLGGTTMNMAGGRAVPSLKYLYRQQAFSIGPKNEEDENTTLEQLIAKTPKKLVIKTANNTNKTATNMVPQGGLFWDGRASTLQEQAAGPLFNPVEMDAKTNNIVTDKLRKSIYASDFKKLFGMNIFDNSDMCVAQMLFSLARYQIEDPAFRPFTSKYDAWLQGKAVLTEPELRGYLAFNDKDKGNCAACHIDKVSKDGLPPLFTDTEYEAIGVPRNNSLAINDDPTYYDLGLCDRSDLKKQTQFCGMFLTPTLRNVATRHVFFHNGVLHSLKQVLEFYNFRDTEQYKVYPKNINGGIAKFNDLPAKYHSNIDIVDQPFNHKLGDKSPMSEQDMTDIIAFLSTLTDGFVVNQQKINIIN